MKKVYVSRLLTDTVMSELSAIDGVEFVVGEEAPPSREELLKKISGVDGAIVCLTERIDKEFFEAAGPQLKVVANVAVGFDNIDVAEAAARSVTITNTPGVLDGATADHTMALILAMTRRVVEADTFLREGNQWVWGPRMLTGLDVSNGTTIAIVGLGRIGQAVARRARAFDMNVIGVDAAAPVGSIVAGVEVVSMEDAVSRADIVSLHVPLLPSTRHLVDADFIASMKPGSYLVNVARGGVVDEAAMMVALDSGHLRGAALDVFEGEPAVNPKLFTYPQIVITPHTASAGDKTRDDMCRLAVGNVTAVLGGGEPLTPVALKA
jgi:Lactate dehydrogenase and related dehydrogenases